MLKTPLKFIVTIILTLGLSMSFQSLLASWTAPTVNPPGGNISEPINVGSVAQSKSGLLSLTNGLSVSGNIILDGNLTLGGVNRTILTSNGTATFGSTNSHTYLRSAATGNIYLQTGTINRLAVLAGGNVGIGTINPSQRLDVNGNINLSGANRTILANAGPATFGSTNSHLYLRSANTSSNIYLQTGTTNNRLTVLGNGNVGIGVSNPNSELDVAGTISSNYLCLNGDCRGSWPEDTTTSGGPIGFVEQYINLNEDTYTSRSLGTDTCNNNLVQYSCPANVNRACIDRWQECYNDCSGESCNPVCVYNYRDVVCKAAVVLVKDTSSSASTSGTATITGRDYSGSSEKCWVTVTIGACSVNRRSPSRSHWDDALCKQWVERDVQANLFCPTPTNITNVNWALSGDNGPLSIEYMN